MASPSKAKPFEKIRHVASGLDQPMQVAPLKAFPGDNLEEHFGDPLNTLMLAIHNSNCSIKSLSLIFDFPIVHLSPTTKRDLRSMRDIA